MFIEHISGDSVLAAEMRCSTVMVTAPPVVMFTTASVACLMRGRNSMKTDASGDGRPSFGSRACRCRMAAPAAAASIAWVAIWSGVIGSASDMVGVWIEPVIAQLMTIFAMMFSSLSPCGAFAWCRAKFLYRRRRLGNAELRDDGINDVAGMRRDRNRNRPFVRRRRFQCRELAVEQRRRHEVIVARGEAPLDQFAVAFEEDETHIAPLANEDIAIDVLERRAGDDPVTARIAGVVDPGGDGAQPRPAIRVGERLAVMHFFDVRLRMEPVAVFVDPVQAVGQHRRDRALAATGNAHHHDDGRNVRRRFHDTPCGAAARSMSHTRSPLQCTRAPGKSSPENTRCKMSRLSAPSTKNSISRVEASAGNVSVTRGTNGSHPALATPSTQRSFSSSARDCG